ncbi:MAG: YidC/Oxa1 family membrane protein insertase [Clostridia bacterium]|nr:YidC/Oxa1 family membrane protein insertase [Clostridia bacterium]MBR5986514.1 YidC/Oxa1 family membrane protein insertase [Clostridia bacterium]
MTNLFISILNWVQSFIGSYGWSVIVFTLLIKLVLLPLDVKSRRSMKAMSALNPKIEELKKRYANDQQKLNMKTQELYKKSGVNPLSGCLPMLIQLPILYIMFAAMRRVAAQLQVDIMYAWLRDAGVWKDGAFDLEALETVVASIKDGTVDFGNTQSWLWIKSVFQPDNFGRTVIPTVSELTTTWQQYYTNLFPELENLGKAEGFNALIEMWSTSPEKLPEDFNKLSFLMNYLNLTSLKFSSTQIEIPFVEANNIASMIDNAIAASVGYQKASVIGLFSMSIPSSWGRYVNGYCVLPILACATQVLATKLTPGQGETQGQSQGGAGKFMKWLFPIMSLWICWSSTASFAIYWVFVNVWSIVSGFAVNYYIDHSSPRGKMSRSDKQTKEILQP